MKLIKLLILLFFALNLYSQNLDNQNDSIYFLEDKKSYKFEGSIYLSENLELNHSFGENSGIVYSLAIKISDEILLGMTTQDTEVANQIRNIHHFLMKYKIKEYENHNFYISLKIPSSKFTKIENDQLKFLRGGFGYKHKIYEKEKSSLYIDLNQDFLIDWDNNSTYNPTLLIGISYFYND